MSQNFYVYGHYDGDNLIYIGKGTKKRAYSFKDRNEIWNNFFAELHPEVRILKEDLSEEMALNLEKQLIEKHSPPANIMSGGGGFTSKYMIEAWKDEKYIGSWTEGMNMVRYTNNFKKSHSDGIKKHYQENPEAKKRQSQNMKKVWSIRKQGTRVTHCPRGHEYTEENTYRRPSKPNKRECKICKRNRNKRG